MSFGKAAMATSARAIVRVGVDLSKTKLQIHAVGSDDSILAVKRLEREEFLEWCGELPQGCLVAMEACCGAHHWARALTSLGLQPRLISPALVTPYRVQGKTGKNDANDAAAICEAASRSHIRLVPVKSEEQQGWLAVHTLRDGYVKDRTACMNRVRGVLGEFGIGIGRSPKCLHEAVPPLLMAKNSPLPNMARIAMRDAYDHLVSLDRHIKRCDSEIRRHVQSDPAAKLAFSMHGVGVLCASAVVAQAGSLARFKNGRQFSAWVGLVPSQRSSGERVMRGRITRRGNPYLRRLLIAGAVATLRFAAVRQDPVSEWAMQLRKRIGGRKAAVAVANRNARRLWRLLVYGPDGKAQPQGSQACVTAS